MPGVDIAQTRAFSKVWDSGGIKILLDETSLKFAKDWANIVLKSFIADQQAKFAAAVKAAKEKEITGTDTVSEQTVAPTVAQKSSIILTD